MTPCRPSRPQSQCLDCQRRTMTIPGDWKARQRAILIDVTAILPEGRQCELYVKNPAAPYWWEQPTEKHFDGVHA
jgi:hypothetical protein